MEAYENDEQPLRSTDMENATDIECTGPRAEDELSNATEPDELRTQELAQCRALMSAILESTTDAILVTDPAGNVRAFNHRFTQIWQVSREIMEAGERQHLRNAMSRHFENPRAFLARIDDIYATAPPESHDLLERADGSVIERFSRVQVVDQRIAGRVWSFRDISERRRAEEAIQKQSERMRITLASIGDGVISTDGLGNVTFLNGVAEALTGWKQSEAEGRPLPEVFHIVNEQTRQEAENPALRALREGKIVGLANHTLLVARDGTERPIDDSAAPIRDAHGTTSGAVLVFRDVTVRRRVEEARAWQAAIVDSSQDAIVSKTLQGIILSWNSGAEKLFGYTANEAIGKPITLIIPPDRQDEERAILDRLRRGERIEHYETVRVARDGRAINISLTISPVRDAAGRIVGASKVARDITAQKESEAALREAKLDADKANHAKTQFLAILSHELRTPLNPIMLAVTAMLERPEEPEQMHSTLEMIRQNVNLQARLIDDLLDVMRIVRGKMPLHWEIADGHRLIEHAIEVCRSDLNANGLRLSVELAAEEHHVNADGARLQQVFWNLIKNAVKFTPHGGAITIRTRNVNQAPGGETMLSVEVSDTGIGIEPEILPAIFDPFQQGEITITRTYGGLGLGLAICRGIIEAHGGTLTASSEGKGRGATFQVVLTALQGSANEFADSPESRVPDLSSTTRTPLSILVVEDDAATMRLMARLLRALGYQVTTAGSIANALEEIEAARFDLIISDIGLADGSGLDLMRQVVSRHGPVPAIALTGYGMEEDIRRSHAAGFTAHLTKPIDFTKLAAMILQVAR